MNYIDFTGTAYLGLPDNAAFMDLIYKGIEKYGINFGGSRLNNAVPEIYNSAEDFFAEKLFCDNSLIASSGTLTGVLLANYLKKNNFELYVSEDLHPALKCNFSSYSTFEDLEDLLPSLKDKEEKTLNAVLLNTINPVTLRTIDLGVLSKFHGIDNVIFVFDDSHGIGISGDNNWGIAEIVKEIGLKYIILSSLAKAFSLEGGILAGEKKIIENIKKTSLWGGASPPPPFYFYALVTGENIFKDQLQKLKRNINYFIDNLKNENDFKFLPDFPVILNIGKPVYDHLLEKRIKISAFRYPTKNDPLTERIVINANHSLNDLDLLLNSI
ncbi:MAG TPA: aminotransferase class I/II-fold pyridoxal phosphate-dependent enzyme [Bacteroidetes bacterium]|nr:aminotransferase class I/II-fold pyridoxal phosphate-dependent enzyme [Bacteroidota bacterium]